MFFAIRISGNLILSIRHSDSQSQALAYSTQNLLVFLTINSLSVVTVEAWASIQMLSVFNVVLSYYLSISARPSL